MVVVVEVVIRPRAGQTRGAWVTVASRGFCMVTLGLSASGLALAQRNYRREGLDEKGAKPAHFISVCAQRNN